MRSGGRILCWLATTVVLCARAALLAEETTPVEAEARGDAAVIDAEKLSFDRPSNMAYGEGHVVINYLNSVLVADRVKYNTVTKDVWAEGHVRLTREAQEWTADQIFYNFESHDLKMGKTAGFFEPIFFGAAEVHSVGSNQYAFVSGALTACDYDHPHYRVEAKHGVIYPGDRIVLHNVTFRLGDVPVFWFPVMVWSLTGDQPPVVLSLGDSSKMGFFVLTSTYLRLSDSVGLTVHLDERTERGFAPGADLRYKIGKTGKGLLSGYYLNDANPMASTNIFTGTDIPRNRYRAQWDHEQALTDSLDLNFTLNKQSDRAVVKDFFYSEFLGQRDPETTAAITKRGPNYTLSLLARPQSDPEFPETTRLPEVRLAINRTRLGATPFYYESETSYATLHNAAGSSGVTNFYGNSLRADSFHQIVMPQLLGGWLSVVPRAGVRGTYYSRAPDQSGQIEDATRSVFDLGTEISTKAARTWDNVKIAPLRIDGLRHIVQPFADYQWVPTSGQGTNELFQFDTVRYETLKNGSQLSLTRYSPLEFPAFNTIDAIDRQDLLRFGLRQRLQTRRDGKPWDLVELESWTDWHIEQNRGENTFSDWYTTTQVRPFDWIALNVFTRYDLHANVLPEINTEFRVTDGDRWSFGIGSRILKNDSNIGSLGVAYQLSRHWMVDVQQRVDFQDGLWELQQYGLRQETHDWFINYGFRYSRSQTDGSDTSVFVSFTLKAFPGFTLGANNINVNSSTVGN